MARILKPLLMLNRDTVEINFLDDVRVDEGGVKSIYKLLDEFTEEHRIKKLMILSDVNKCSI